MNPSYEIVVAGNNLRLKDDFLGMSNVTLIHGGRGPILFDTGGYISRLGLLKKLRERGLEPSDIKTVFLSHLHFDHAHNIDLFRNARIVVSRTEWNYAANPHPDDLLVPWGILDQLSRGQVDLIDGEGELEPGISYFPAPGHTPGSYALRFESAEKGRVIIAGDAIKYIKEAILARCDMAFDTLEAGTATIKHILATADRIVPGHFPELIRQPEGSFSWEGEAPFNLLVR
ncbi:N-acyl homoserine lactonase family protein [Mesorhizobium sp. NZP2298]|uniref:N-acyl homoserine lactonase family protein n=1 Tax=Mesorhizobium sp. NZP2298 TaxID=2483403 RepID=UPI0015567031|nr:N-acyl homoserine lactonase family protein [Mesorhizobium sp. NZP2298]QKC94690.1 N-acyl homoserine lactonase family protein [Mesorhizobium sp. NZP2298]